jgi:hypothetical protein
VEAGAAAVDVLAGALGGGSAAPVVAAMRAMPGVFDASVAYEAESGGGLLVCEAHVAEGSVGRALDRLTSLLADARSGRIDAAEIGRTRLAFASDRLARRESADGRATDAASSLAHFGRAEAWRDHDARIAATDVGEVRAIARRLLDPATARVIVLAPRIRTVAPRWSPSRAPLPGSSATRTRLPNGLRLLVERDASPVAAVRIVGLGDSSPKRPRLRASRWPGRAPSGAGPAASRRTRSDAPSPTWPAAPARARDDRASRCGSTAPRPFWAPPWSC